MEQPANYLEPTWPVFWSGAAPGNKPSGYWLSRSVYWKLHRRAAYYRLG
jgi:hypothetical protein